MEKTDYDKIKQIESKFGTPFYVLDIEQYKKNVCEFRNAFSTRYDKIIVGYSFKTNYIPALCYTARELGCYAEVVSSMELDLALSFGFKKIIFNGPIKTKESLLKAIRNKAIINLDSLYEIEYLKEIKSIYPSLDIKVGLRINMELKNNDGFSIIQNGLRFGRFGFTKEALNKAIPSLKSLGIKIISLHGHTSTSDRAVSNFKIISKKLLSVAEEYDLNDIIYFNIGGGFFGAAANGINTSNKPTYKDYADCIIDTTQSNNWFISHQPTIIIEPGVSVIANVLSYVAKVFQVKTLEDHTFTITNGNVFEVKPSMHNINLPHKFIYQKEHDKSIQMDVVGSTCMEKDILLNSIKAQEPQYGDYIIFNGVGAYTIVFTPNFINYQSPIITINNDEEVLIRRRQTLQDVLNPYILEK